MANLTLIIVLQKDLVWVYFNYKNISDIKIEGILVP